MTGERLTARIARLEELREQIALTIGSESVDAIEARFAALPEREREAATRAVQEALRQAGYEGPDGVARLRAELAEAGAAPR